ncbi:hypothetical protein [Actinacidiphila acididurans]|nr:hypothetical protein [Actinacidiphila acididurans]
MSSTHLNRSERLTLVRMALSGTLSGIARAVTTWVLEHIFS